VIVADRGNNRLQLLSFDGTSFNGLFDVHGGFNGPTGVSAYGGDRILVADTGNNAIKQVIPYAGESIVGELPGQQGTYNAPRGVAASGSDGSAKVGAGDTVIASHASASVERTGFIRPPPPCRWAARRRRRARTWPRPASAAG